MVVALGVCFEVAATMVGTAGKQLVSYSARAESKRTARAFKFAGIFITTLIGPLLDMTAYALAPQAIIAPLNGLDIVWNTASAPLTLGERVSPRHVVGSGLVFVGAALTSALGPHHTTEDTLEWMRKVFISLRFVSFVLTFGAFLAVCIVTLRIRPKGTGDRARGVALSAMAGGIAGNMYFMSAGLGCLRSSVQSGDWSAWADWLPYVVLLCGIAMALANIPLMTKALQEYNALFVVTLFEGSHMVVACVTGCWVLREMDHEHVGRQVLYWFCVLFIAAGLLVIQSTATGNRGLVDLADETSSGTRPLSSPSVANTEGASSVEDSDGAAQQQQPQRSPPSFDSGVVVWAGHLSGIGSATFAADELSEDPASSDDDDDTNEDDLVGAGDIESNIFSVTASAARPQG